MGHESVKLIPGINEVETPALNEAGFSQSNLIRFMYDPKQGALVQKLGGWAKYYGTPMQTPVRALHAWEDTNSVAHLGVGMQNSSGTFNSGLAVVTNGSLSTITPQISSDNINLNQGGSPVIATVAGNSIVTVTDNTITNVTQYDSVYIPVHISVGGIVLFGSYPCDPNGYLSANSYTIQSTDALGNPLPAGSTVSAPAGVSVASFSTVSGNSSVTVTLPNHGYSPGSTYPILAETSVGGTTLYGNYIVQSVTSSSVFTILALTTPSATATASINGGLARFIYSFGAGSIPTGTGYGIGGYGTGGYGTGTGVSPSSGNTTISANDWTLDNWGQQLIACPISPNYNLTPTSFSGNGASGTLAFSQTFTQPIPVGETITLSGFQPYTLNGAYTVTASSSTSVSFATSVTSATALGSAVWNNTPYQPIFYWDPTQGSPVAQVLPFSPQINDGIMIAMPQRQIIAWGSSFTGIQDPLLVRWCDVGNYSTWIGTVTNQAGSYRIPKGSKIVGGIQSSQQGLLWTDVGLWAMQYIGLPYVYAFNEIADKCGLIGRKAAATFNGAAYWMGPSQFYMLGADGVQPVPCPLWDIIFQEIDQNNLSKIRVAVNSRFGEISWYFPTLTSGGEVAMYVKFNVYMNAWDYGSLSRSAWIDQSVLGAPIGADPNRLSLYQHEILAATGATLTDADTSPMQPSFQTGYFAIADGDEKTFIDQIWPDMKWGLYGGSQNANLSLTFYVADYPNSTIADGGLIVYGPYAINSAVKYVTPRLRGRLVSLAVSGSDSGTFWRIGNIRYRGQPDGKF